MMRKSKPTLKEYLSSYQNKRLNKSTSSDLHQNISPNQSHLEKIEEKIDTIKHSLKKELKPTVFEAICQELEELRLMERSAHVDKLDVNPEANHGRRPSLHKNSLQRSSLRTCMAQRSARRNSKTSQMDPESFPMAFSSETPSDPLEASLNPGLRLCLKENGNFNNFNQGIPCFQNLGFNQNSFEGSFNEGKFSGNPFEQSVIQIKGEGLFDESHRESFLETDRTEEENKENFNTNVNGNSFGDSFSNSFSKSSEYETTRESFRAGEGAKYKENEKKKGYMSFPPRPEPGQKNNIVHCLTVEESQTYGPNL